MVVRRYLGGVGKNVAAPLPTVSFRLFQVKQWTPVNSELIVTPKGVDEEAGDPPNLE